MRKRRSSIDESNSTPAAGDASLLGAFGSLGAAKAEKPGGFGHKGEAVRPRKEAKEKKVKLGSSFGSLGPAKAEKSGAFTDPEPVFGLPLGPSGAAALGIELPWSLRPGEDSDSNSDSEGGSPPVLVTRAQVCHDPTLIRILPP